jgi:ankyrin repeat protein
VVNVLAGIGDLNAVDKMGRSALSFARSMGRTEAERILLAHGARPAPVAAVNGSTYQ